MQIPEDGISGREREWIITFLKFVNGKVTGREQKGNGKGTGREREGKRHNGPEG